MIDMYFYKKHQIYQLQHPHNLSIVNLEFNESNVDTKIHTT